MNLLPAMAQRFWLDRAFRGSAKAQIALADQRSRRKHRHRHLYACSFFFACKRWNLFPVSLISKLENELLKATKPLPIRSTGAIKPTGKRPTLPWYMIVA
jgi:hypothetical protein